MTQDLLKVSDLSFVAQGKTILEDVNFTIGSGDLITLIGPNGAGKSTLLRVLLGLLKQTTGTVQVQPGIKIGYMPQKLVLDRSMAITVDYFLRLSHRPRLLSVREALHDVGASKLQFSSMHELSGGEMQRVLLARAMLSKPELMILDEPVQGVDIQGQADLYALLSGIRKRWNCAMLVVSHDMHMVMSTSDRVICLNRHICCQGQPDSIVDDPGYTSLFAPYSHNHSHRHDAAPDEKDDPHNA